MVRFLHFSPLSPPVIVGVPDAPGGTLTTRVSEMANDTTGQSTRRPETPAAGRPADRATYRRKIDCAGGAQGPHGYGRGRGHGPVADARTTPPRPDDHPRG